MNGHKKFYRFFFFLMLCKRPLRGSGILTLFGGLLPLLAFSNTEWTFVVSAPISRLAPTYGIAADSARFKCKLFTYKHETERLMLTQYNVLKLMMMQIKQNHLFYQTANYSLNKNCSEDVKESYLCTGYISNRRS